jgi:hypothetical protein
MKKNILLVAAMIGFNLQAINFNTRLIECLEKYPKDDLIVDIERELHSCEDNIIDELKKLTPLGGTGEINYEKLNSDLSENEECLEALVDVFNDLNCLPD